MSDIGKYGVELTSASIFMSDIDKHRDKTSASIFMSDIDKHRD